MRENKQLKEQCGDLENLLSLNKQALVVATMPQQTKAVRGSQTMRFGKKNNPFLGGKEDTQINRKNELISRLLSENKLLAESLEARTNERNEAQNKVFLCERIIEQNNEFETEIVEDYEDKLEKMKMNIRTKEYVLHEMEILRSLPQERANLDPQTYVIYKEVSFQF